VLRRQVRRLDLEPGDRAVLAGLSSVCLIIPRPRHRGPYVPPPACRTGPSGRRPSRHARTAGSLSPSSRSGHQRPGRRRSCLLAELVASEARHYCGPGSGHPLLVRRPGMLKVRSGLTDRAPHQQESRSVSHLWPDPDRRCHVAPRQAPVPLPTMPTASPGCVSDVLSHSGLDQYASMFAPCLLGCPGTPRQHLASAPRRGFRRPDKMAAPGTC